tara:strand:+ start:20148 stop:20396 length:249 start_codon:yes stop_codon:yes gene_type:complete
MTQKEKLLHVIAAKYIMSENIEVDLEGNFAEVKCLQELLEISKSLKESLDRDESFDKIISILKEKKEITKKFENLSGITWRL